jgi:hypothetical protein
MLEFFNEATILLCCYHIFCFTNFVDDPIMRYNVGFSLIVSTALNIVVNVTAILIETLYNLFRIYKISLLRFR